jgi:hypothetical protein
MRIASAPSRHGIATSAGSKISSRAAARDLGDRPARGRVPDGERRTGETVDPRAVDQHPGMARVAFGWRNFRGYELGLIKHGAHLLHAQI